MKVKKHFYNYIFLTFIFTISACSPPVTFDKPQPLNAVALSGFPKRLQGDYLSRDKVSILSISEKLAVRRYDFALKLSKDSLDKKYRLSGDTLTETTAGKTQIVTIADDTLYADNSGTDTLFFVSETNVLKKYKGYYFLNKLYDNDAWTLQRISLSGGILTLSEITDSVHINQLKEITETPADTICSNFKLSQQQFNKFIKSNGFDQSEQFTRISGK